MVTLIIATRNLHKVEEIRAVLLDTVRYGTLNDFEGAPAVIEDAGSFAGNATKKAVELARWLADNRPTIGAEAWGAAGSEVFCLADDSGLEVDALGGAPGVHSARFAALDSGGVSNSSDAANMSKLLRLLARVPPAERTARFRCVLALTPIPSPSVLSESPVCNANEAELRTELFDGVCEGRIDEVARGLQGFGYDPVFIPVGFRESFGELGEEVKSRMSHRAKALHKLQAWLQKQGARESGCNSRYPSQ